MDFRLSGLLSSYVLILMLLEVQCGPVFPTPTPTQTSCDENLINTEPLIKLLRHHLKDLPENYTNLHGPLLNASPKDVPESTISGTNISMKLQDIYVKNVLFSWHISKVEEYLKELRNETALDKDLDVALLHVKGSLTNLLGRIKTNLVSFDPVTSLPTPAAPQLSHGDDFAKYQYGFEVIVALKDWVSEVLQVLQSKEVCDRPEQSGS